jgi:hypothetical protein
MQIQAIGGTSQYLCEQALKKALKASKKEAGQSNKTNVLKTTVFADEITSLKDIPNISGEIGMFSQSNLIIIRNLFSQANTKLRDETLDFLKSQVKNIRKSIESQANSETHIIFFENTKFRKNLKLYKFFKKNLQIEEFNEPDEKYKKKFVDSYLKGHSLKLDSEIQMSNFYNLFIQKPLLNIVNELDKLRLLKEAEGEKEKGNDENQKIVFSEDLKIINSEIEEQIWELFNLGIKDKPQAFELLEQLIEQDITFYQIIGFLESQIKAVINYYYFPEELNYYVKRKITPIARQINKNKLQLLVNKLFNLDQKLKSTAMDPKVGLVLYLSIL